MPPSNTFGASVPQVSWDLGPTASYRLQPAVNKVRSSWLRSPATNLSARTKAKTPHSEMTGRFAFGATVVVRLSSIEPTSAPF
jgi:hypothetical protein